MFLKDRFEKNILQSKIFKMGVLTEVFFVSNNNLSLLFFM